MNLKKLAFYLSKNNFDNIFLLLEKGISKGFFKNDNFNDFEIKLIETFFIFTLNNFKKIYSSKYLIVNDYMEFLEKNNDDEILNLLLNLEATPILALRQLKRLFIKYYGQEKYLDLSSPNIEPSTHFYSDPNGKDIRTYYENIDNSFSEYFLVLDNLDNLDKIKSLISESINNLDFENKDFSFGKIKKIEGLTKTVRGIPKCYNSKYIFSFKTEKFDYLTYTVYDLKFFHNLFNELQDSFSEIYEVYEEPKLGEIFTARRLFPPIIDNKFIDSVIVGHWGFNIPENKRKDLLKAIKEKEKDINFNLLTFCKENFD